MNGNSYLASLLALSLFSSPARAVQWSIGANLGMSAVHRPGRAGGITHWGLPAGAGPGGYSEGTLTGLRAGLLTNSTRQGFFLDGGYRSSKRGDSGEDSYQLTANYEFAILGAPHAWNPYATTGWGWNHSGYEFPGSLRLTGDAAIYGAGAGIRYRVGHGHGLLRGEVRYDWTDGATDQGVLLTARSSSVALKLGFDLWL
jgi:hypothetical protein